MNIASTLDICRNLPEEAKSKISRDHLVEEIIRTIDTTGAIVIISGETMSGKSDLAADLMRKDPECSIGIFLGPDSYFKSRDYIRLIVAEQITWIVEGTTFNEDAVSDDNYQTLLYKLQKYARNKKILWLIDGLFGGKGESTKDIEEILKLFPLAVREFNFVITCEDDANLKLKNISRGVRKMPVMLVSPDEARKFFENTIIEEADIQEARSMCGSNVGRMQKVRSLLLGGGGLHDLLKNNDASLESLMQIEWDSCEYSEDSKKAIAAVVFSESPVTIKAIAEQFFMSEELVVRVVQESKILNFNNNNISSPGYISIESWAQKGFAAKKLSLYEKGVRTAAIDRMLRLPSEKEATQYLPLQLAKAGRHDELLKQLDPDHFVRLLETQKTLRSLRYHAELGREAAQKMGEFATELTFSLITSLATGLTFAVGLSSKIEAFSKMKRYDLALEIASGAATSEEKLHLFARAASIMESQRYPLPQAAKEQITILVEGVDGDSLGDLAIEIACDLLAIDFKLAYELLQKAIAGVKKVKNENQENINKSEVELNEENEREKTGGAKKTQKTELPEHKLRYFWSEVGRRVANQKADAFLLSVKSQDPEFALLLCKKWLENKVGNEEVYLIANAALDLVIKNVSRSPQVSDFREISEILPANKITSDSEDLRNRLETQYRILNHHGTSSESIRLRLNLYSASYQGGQQDIELDLINIFVEIDEIKEISSRATCWAWMLHHLAKFSHSQMLEEKTSLSRDVRQKLESTIDELLLSSADHYQAAKAAIEAISLTDAGSALLLIERLNTVAARDQGYLAITRTLTHRHAENSATIAKAVLNIEDQSTRNTAIIHLLMSLRRRRDANNSWVVSDQILKLAEKVGFAPYKFQATAVSMAYKLEMGEPSDQLNKKLYEIWCSVADNRVKIELGYLAASEFAESNLELAQGWIKEAEQLSKKTTVGSEGIVYALYSSLKLGARLLPSLTAQCNSLDECEAIKRFGFLAESLSTQELQLRIWCDLSVRLHFANQSNLAKEILDKYIRPIVDSDFDNDEHFRERLVIESAPIFYLCHQSSTLHKIDQLTSCLNRDRAREGIVRVLLRKVPLWEFFAKGDEAEYVLTQESVEDILNLLAGIRTDYLVFAIVSDLCRGLVADKNKQKIPRNSALDFLNRIKSIVDKNLPDTLNIKHEGFLISAHALIQKSVFSIQKSSAIQQAPYWENLFNRAASLKNVSDRVVVKAMVGVNSRIKSGNIENWLQSVKEDLPAIPSTEDRLDRYEWIARIIESSDKLTARNLLKEGMKISSHLPSSDDVLQQQRRLLDLAHNIDPDLATELIEQFDNDEARKESLEKRVEGNKRRKAVASKPDCDDIDDIDDNQLSHICEQNLGSLIAGRISPRPIEDFLSMNRRARSMPLNMSMPIWELTMENAVRKKGPLNAPINQCEALFNATCKASEIAIGLIGRLGSSHLGDNVSGTIKAGDREIFLGRVSDWAAMQSGELIYISDPYFSPDDLDFLKLLHDSAPGSRFRIATSREQMKKKKIEDADEAFQDAWNIRYDIDPPPTDFAVVGFGPEGKHPIHDRWILSEKSGLRLGSSINSLGLTRLSDLSELSFADAFDKVSDVSSLFLGAKSFNGQKLRAVFFKL